MLESINGWGYYLTDKINPSQLSMLMKINTNQLSISPQVSSSTPATANQITDWNFMTFWSFVTHGNKQEVTEVITPVAKSFSFRKKNMVADFIFHSNAYK